MRNLEKSVPVIRFKGFSEAWEQRKLGEESDVRDGTHDSPKYVNTGHPLVTSKNLKDFGLDFSGVSFISDEDFESINKRSKVDVGDILFGMIGTIGTPVQLIRKDFAIKNVALIKEKKNILNRFLIHLLKSAVFDRYIENENTGGTQKFLSLSKIRNFCFLSPKLEEQDQISLFFKQLDNAIALHQRKLDTLKLMKKGFLQQMFPNNDEEIPKVRFADFDGMWKQRKLNSITEKITRKNKELESTLPLTISAQDGLIDQNEYFNKIIASRNIRGYFLVKNGEFAYNKSYSKGYPWGVVKRLDNYNMGVLSTLYIIFKPVKINSDFLTKYFDSTYWYRAVSQFATEGARNHGLLNIAASDFFEIELNIPLNNEEQKKIGLFFQQLENIIILHQNKLEKLSILKKTYLKKMFI
ncbi:restriction endonuclease subunit S [Listeria monocytogenes]|nr:restriction endonuclease subunit S [Listeria monocytogenes]